MDMTTTYMGLSLKNPLIASASPFNGEIGMLGELEDHGAAAVVLPSVFEEQITADQRHFETLTECVSANGTAEAQSDFPKYDGYGFGPDGYLEIVRRAKAAIEIPVIGSLNCVSNASWIDYAKPIQEAGADAIELNIYFIPTDLTLTGHEVEQRYLGILRAVKTAVSIPVSVKLGPHFSAIGAMAQTLADGGTDALMLPNRFYQPDIDTFANQLRSSDVLTKFPILAAV